jgi:hypothetical protein
MKTKNETLEALRLSKNIPLSAVLKAIDDEPEYPGKMPDVMFEMIKNDKSAMEEAMRITVRLTKIGIKNRVMELDNLPT